MNILTNIWIWIFMEKFVNYGLPRKYYEFVSIYRQLYYSVFTVS